MTNRVWLLFIYFGTKVDKKTNQNRQKKLYAWTDRKRFTNVTYTHQQKHCSRVYKFSFNKFQPHTYSYGLGLGFKVEVYAVSGTI